MAAVGTLEVGQEFKMPSGIVHVVIRQGDMGTMVRKANKVAKQVFDKRSGKTVRFSSFADPYMISSGSEVTPL